jgi:hypothetical protein
MEMTNEEILRNYRQAKDRRMQIGILADLNQCGTVRIVEILTEGGIPAEELPKIKKHKAPLQEEPKPRPVGRPRKERQDDTLESAIEKKLRARVKAHGGQCLKWVSPGESGVPDRIVLLPGGRVVFVETKRPKGGKLSPLQNHWGRVLRGLGFEVWVVWNPGDLAEFEKQVLGGEE